MTQWAVNFTSEADNDVSKLGNAIRRRIFEKIKWLSANFEEIQHLPLGYQWQDFFKLRVADWRVVYEIDYRQNEITIHRVEHRSKVYQRQK